MEKEFWSDVCFMGEQTVQMALKAFLFGAGRRFMTTHSIQELARQCAEVDAGFSDSVEWGKVLDRYYIPRLWRHRCSLSSRSLPAMPS